MRKKSLGVWPFTIGRLPFTVYRLARPRKAAEAGPPQQRARPMATDQQLDGQPTSVT